MAFIVEKDRVSKKITIEITSLSLKQAIYRAILNQSPGQRPLHLDFDALLKNYDRLKSQCQRLEAKYPHEETTAELSLLVNDLFLERGLYDGIGMEGFRQRRVLCMSHLQDIHQRSLDIGLDEIEDCFPLGLIPDEINEEYLQALNIKFSELASSGDHDGLQNLCEPIVRSGEIEIQYNPALLLEVLNNGQLDAYLYMLDLVDRTRDNTMQFQDPLFSDVTFDPFHVSIRLGQVDTVRAFVKDNTWFEGKVSETQGGSADNHVFTPLSAAAYWRQPDVLRILLESGPFYLSGYEQAMTLALAGGFEDVLEVFSNHQNQPPSVIAGSFLSPPHPKTPEANLPFYSSATSPGSSAMNQIEYTTTGSISALTNGLASCGSETTVSFDVYGRLNSIDPPVVPTVDDLETLPMWDVSTDALDLELPLSEPWELLSQTMPDFQQPQQQPNQHPFLKQRNSHNIRRKYGQGLVQRLDAQCKKLHDLCKSRPNQDAYIGIMRYFSSMECIWEAGIEVFRQITRNRVPSSLVEVLHCLLVADSLCFKVAGASDDLSNQYASLISLPFQVNLM